MTHYLRSRHDGILVGIGTVVADNPSLNCRLSGVAGYEDATETLPATSDTTMHSMDHLHGQPRPIVLDPRARWDVGRPEGWKVLELARQGKGKAPFVITCSAPSEEQRTVLQSVGGLYYTVDVSLHHAKSAETVLDPQGLRMGWEAILHLLSQIGIESVMIEGGGNVINQLLEDRNREYVTSVIVTIAPVWLGTGGVIVSPCRASDEEDKGEKAVARLQKVKWITLGEDVVLCGRF
jgi:2,5-diamino-6-(ribosylamino)-4(3H)-pyrimidinone 5'-phosphate reductase